MDEHQLKRLELIEQRLQDHIEHYAQNNKTLALLQQRMDYFIQRFEKHDVNEIEYNKKIEAHFDRMAKLDVNKLSEVVENYRGVVSARNMLLGLAGIIVAISTIGAGFATFIHYIRH